MSVLEKPTHHQIHCKECNPLTGHYIIGWRYKCLNCVAYDLCEICFRYTKHDSSHVFGILKTKCDLPLVQMGKPLLKKTLYPENVATTTTTPICSFLKPSVFSKPDTFSFMPPSETPITNSLFRFDFKQGASSFSSASPPSSSSNLFSPSSVASSKLPLVNDINMDI